MQAIRRHEDHSPRTFLKRTVSAQLHLLGCLAAIAGLTLLLFALKDRGAPHVIACLLFGLTSILVFGVSTVYHFISDGYVITPKLELMLEDLDHFAIFLFIAGTYTPVLLNVIAPPWREYLLVAIWVVGLSGIVYTRYKPRLPRWAQHRFVYTSIFLLMGWTLLVRINEAWAAMSPRTTWLLLAGGVAYSIGAVVYATKWPNPIRNVFGFHEIWHCFVLLGYACHYFMVLSFYT